MARYEVRIGEREFTVEVAGDSARIEGRAVVLEGSVIPGELVARSGDEAIVVAVHSRDGAGRLTLLVDGLPLVAAVASERERLAAAARPRREETGPLALRSTIPGVVRKVYRGVGDAVEADDAILTLEAMKMENVLCAGRRGIVIQLHVAPGQCVAAGATLAVIGAGPARG